MKNYIAINTKTDKVLIKIDEEATQKEIIHELKSKLAELNKLYQNEKIPIILTGKYFDEDEQKEITNILKRYNDTEIKFENKKSLGLHGIKNVFKKEIATSETKFHRGSIRSGQKIEFDGSLVILGDVNSGAEVLAGENVIVLGILRGMVHAGANGNKEAIVAAASIESAQIRIANIIKEIEKEEIEEQLKTSAYVDENDKIIIE